MFFHSMWTTTCNSNIAWNYSVRKMRRWWEEAGVSEFLVTDGSDSCRQDMGRFKYPLKENCEQYCLQKAIWWAGMCFLVVTSVYRVAYPAVVGGFTWLVG